MSMGDWNRLLLRLAVLVLVGTAIICSEADNTGRGEEAGHDHEEFCPTCGDDHHSETESEIESESETKPSFSEESVGIASYCSPHMQITSHHKIYDLSEIQNIFQDYSGDHTDNQTDIQQLCDGQLYFALTNFTGGEAASENEPAESESRTVNLMANWIATNVCIGAFVNQQDCSIQIGIVELVHKDEAVLFYQDHPEHIPGVLQVEKNLLDASNSHYVLNPLVYPPGDTPFINTKWSHADFLTPSQSPSYMVLLARMQENLTLTCNYTPPSSTTNLHLSHLNHAEYLVNKTTLIIALDRNQNITTDPIGVNMVYFASMDVDCTSGTPNVVHQFGWNDTQFLNEGQSGFYKDVLQQMGNEGWEHYWRNPLDDNPVPYPLYTRCTLDPTATNQCFHVYSETFPRDESQPYMRDEL